MKLALLFTALLAGCAGSVGIGSAFLACKVADGHAFVAQASGNGTFGAGGGFLLPEADAMCPQVAAAPARVFVPAKAASAP